MSTFNPGTGGSLLATNKTQALLELCFLITEQDKVLQEELNVARRSTLSSDLGGQSITFSTTLPCLDTISATGQPTMVVQNYLGAVLGLFNPGGGDLKSTEVPAALVEMAAILSAGELLIPQTVATQTPHTTNVQYNLDAKTVTITANLPIATFPNPTTGGILVEAIDFLP